MESIKANIKSNFARIFGSARKDSPNLPLSGIDEQKLNKLKALSADVRMATLGAIYHVNSGHVGTSLSIVDIITALLFHKMNWKNFLPVVKGKTANEQWRDWQNPELARDRFVLSKGHGVPSWYSALAVSGYIDPEELKSLRVAGSRLQGHPERKRFPFIDGTTGSLGQGQSVALGHALAKKAQGREEKVYCILGDGECNEGQVWESAMSASKFGLDNLVYIIDFNKKQSEGMNEDIMNVEWLHHRWKVFKWHVQRINGHDMRALLRALDETDKVKGYPHVIVADTQKGYMGNGEVFMGGGHSASIDKDSYEAGIKLLTELKHSYGA